MVTNTAARLGESQHDPPITVCLLGDVMTGRGIDQILPHPGDPTLHEPFMQSALGYVALAEQANGVLPRPVDFAYIWGDMLEALAPNGCPNGPAVRLANLETAITTSDDYWIGKGIHYRMHPANVACLAVAGLDCCSLANNHILDWGYAGLLETITQLDRSNIHAVGAGANADKAAAPAFIPVSGGGRVVVFALGSPSSGIPLKWAASTERPGVNLVRSPVYLILIALGIAWRWEWVGGILFIGLGLLYIINAWGQFPWSVYLTIAGPALLIGLLFLVDWRYRAGLQPAT